MASFAQLFSGVNFQSTIRKYCADQQWKIADLNNRRATLRFTMSSGRNQTLFIIKYDSTLEFSVPSGVSFHTIDQIPYYFSTLLLQKNAQNKIGFWCIETIGDKLTFSCMHNAELELLNSKYFANIVRFLTNECDEFEGEVIRMLS